MCTALTAALGSRVIALRALSGGDIHSAHEARLADGRVVFVKSSASAPPGLFAAEAHGLAWLGEARALRVPEVLAIGPAHAAGPAFLALEFIAPGRRARDFDEQLGRGLAALHRKGAPSFGLARDNFLGTLAQDNRPVPSAPGAWAEFYRARRLAPLVRHLADAGAPRAPLRAIEALWPQLPELCGPDEPPARLHGDLWAGNHLCDAQGSPVFIDPAVYGGHREVDLAMMRLFGGFGARAFDSYAESFPLAPGWRARVPLYQIYPVLIHAALFGGGYLAQAAALAREASRAGA